MNEQQRPPTPLCCFDGDAYIWCCGDDEKPVLDICWRCCCCIIDGPIITLPVTPPPVLCFAGEPPKAILIDSFKSSNALTFDAFDAVEWAGDGVDIFARGGGGRCGGPTVVANEWSRTLPSPLQLNKLNHLVLMMVPDYHSLKMGSATLCPWLRASSNMALS